MNRRALRLRRTGGGEVLGQKPILRDNHSRHQKLVHALIFAAFVALGVAAMAVLGCCLVRCDSACDSAMSMRCRVPAMCLGLWLHPCGGSRTGLDEPSSSHPTRPFSLSTSLPPHSLQWCASARACAGEKSSGKRRRRLSRRGARVYACCFYLVVGNACLACVSLATADSFVFKPQTSPGCPLIIPLNTHTRHTAARTRTGIGG